MLGKLARSKICTFILYYSLKNHVCLEPKNNISTPCYIPSLDVDIDRQAQNGLGAYPCPHMGSKMQIKYSEV